MTLCWYYFKKIFFLTFVIQLCVFITFATIVSPYLLIIVKGVDIGFSDVGMLMMLSLIEWSNFLITFSLFIAISWVVYNDFILKDNSILFIQLTESSYNILKCILITNIVCAMFFLFNNLFLAPYSNGILRNRILNTAKKTIIERIVPNHIIVPCLFEELKEFYSILDGMNIVVSSRESNTLFGCLINYKQYNTTLIDECSFNTEKESMFLKLTNAISIINYDNINCNIKCKKCTLNINPDLLTVKKKHNYFSKFDWKKMFDLIKFLLIVLIFAPLCFILIFNKKFFEKCLSIFFFILSIFLINFNSYQLITNYCFILCLLSIIYLFYRSKKCLHF